MNKINMAVKTLCFQQNEKMAMADTPTGQLFSSSSSVPSMAWWNTFGSQSLHGDSKTMNDGQKSLQTTVSLQISLPEHHAHIDSGFSPPMGRVMLPMATHDGPIFVNPKQYHGIIRRRKSRAKAVLESRPIKKRKPFLHLSRHLHAKRRPRGTGGRFLNSKSSNNGNGVMEAKKGSEKSSEILQLSNSEVTRVYSRGDLDNLSINHLSRPAHNLSVIMTTGNSIVMPSKWVAAAGNVNV